MKTFQNLAWTNHKSIGAEAESIIVPIFWKCHILKIWFLFEILSYMTHLN